MAAKHSDRGRREGHRRRHLRVGRRDPRGCVGRGGHQARLRGHRARGRARPVRSGARGPRTTRSPSPSSTRSPTTARPCTSSSLDSASRTPRRLTLPTPPAEVEATEEAPAETEPKTAEVEAADETPAEPEAVLDDARRARRPRLLAPRRPRRGRCHRGVRGRSRAAVAARRARGRRAEGSHGLGGRAQARAAPGEWHIDQLRRRVGRVRRLRARAAGREARRAHLRAGGAGGDHAGRGRSGARSRVSEDAAPLSDANPRARI